MSDRCDTLDWVRDCPSDAVALIGRLEQENADLRARVVQLKHLLAKLLRKVEAISPYANVNEYVLAARKALSTQPSDYRRQLADETIEKVASRLEQVQEYKAANETRKLKGTL